jgi:hypothetical protein
MKLLPFADDFWTKMACKNSFLLLGLLILEEIKHIFSKKLSNSRKRVLRYYNLGNFQVGSEPNERLSKYSSSN